VEGVTLPASGPLLHATLLVGDLGPMVEAYTGLGLALLDRGHVGMRAAQAWQRFEFLGQAYAELGPKGGAALLRLIESPLAEPRPSHASHGWLAMQILVRDVDALAPRAAAAGFTPAGGPHEARGRPQLRVLPLRGPAGELLYLTQVKAAIPPLELPLSAQIDAAHDFGALFAGVMSVPSRQAALQSLRRLAPRAEQCFRAPLGALAALLGEGAERHWPVGVLQWSAASLIEIDEVAHAAVATVADDADRPSHGLSWLTLRAPGRTPGLYRVVPGVWLETV
jgi:hypothetical protein